MDARLGLYSALAVVVLFMHALFIVWVVFGAFVAAHFDGVDFLIFDARRLSKVAVRCVV